MTRLTTFFTLRTRRHALRSTQGGRGGLSFDPVPGFLLPTDGTAKIIQAIAYSPVGKQLAVAGEGGDIVLWNVTDHSIAGRFIGHADTVCACWPGRRTASDW